MSENIHGEFLAAEDLSGRIRKVCSGDDVKCAVAFWGNNAEVELFNPPQIEAKEFKIICDISMGGTNPETIKQLGAPENPNLKHIEGLHAKVYISNSGCVIGSANASDNGVGFQNSAKHLEAGVFHLPRSKVWEKARKWFEKTFKVAKPLDAKAFDECERRWKNRLLAGGKAANLNALRNNWHESKYGGIIDMAISEPDLFHGVGIVICSGAITKAKKDNLIAQSAGILKKTGGNYSTMINNWGDKPIFWEWDEETVKKWPREYIELHKPRNKWHVHFGTYFFGDIKAGTVFAKLNSKLKERFGGKLSPLSNKGNEMLDNLLNKFGSKVYSNVEEFLSELQRLNNI